MCLQGPGHQAAHGAVRGDDVKLVRLLDVDGEVGERLIGHLQLLLGLLVTHDGGNSASGDLGSNTLHMVVWAGRSVRGILISFL